MTDRQRFISCGDLRPVLASLVEMCLQHPDLEERGMPELVHAMNFPPDSFIGKLFDELQPGWRNRQENLAEKLTPEAEAKLVAKIKASAEGPPVDPGEDHGEDKAVTFKRVIPGRRGRLPMVPKRVRDKDKE